MTRKRLRASPSWTRARASSLAGAALTAMFLAAGPAKAVACPAWPPNAAGPPGSVTARDIVRLRDFGPNTLSNDPITSLSPDGREAAVTLRRADPDANRYCSAIMVIALDGQTPPRAIADAGDIVQVHWDMDGISDVLGGAPEISPLRWSPDGQWLAWVRHSGGQVSIWRVRPDGRDAQPVYSSPVDVTRLEWSVDSRSLLFESQPGLVDARHAIETEGLTGFRYDARYWPLEDMAPHPPAPVPTVVQRVDIETGRVTPATPADELRLVPTDAIDRPRDASAYARSPDGTSVAWTAPPYAGAFQTAFPFHIRVAGTDFPCRGEQCEDVTGIWWLGPRDLLLLRRNGVARSRTVLDRWRLGETRPHRLIDTTDVLFGCQMAAKALLCGHEASTKPRELVAIDPNSGKMRSVFDPNPEWHRIELGPVQRLSWRNAFGIETFGDLVLPAHAEAGAKLPLIIVQYDSRGFLRGGVADDYPIQLYAAHGFAVLSFNRPPWFGGIHSPRSFDEFLRANSQDENDRRSYQSSLEAGVQILVQRGIVDPTRVGITGQSDGATAAEYGMIHSNLFAAVALSTCCEDPEGPATIGEGYAERYHQYGLPLGGDPASNYYKQNAIMLSPDRRPLPVLIQASDHEARMALATYETLRFHDWPVEMYVFPNEAHVKFWPAHRLAMYERSLAWFERWLAPKAMADNAGPHSLASETAPVQTQLDAQASASTK